MKKLKILLIEDEPSMRLGIAYTLENAGYQVASVEHGQEGITLFEKQAFDLVITDLRLPGANGIEVLKAVKSISTDTGVILITAFAEVSTAVEAMREGAYDYISKPFEPDELLIVIERFIKQRHLEIENVRLKEALKKREEFERMIGISPPMQALFDTIRTVAQTDSSVMIYGESGTGKELVADAVHKLSERKKGPLIKINCAAIPETLLESELFGHEKGAFTSADRRRKGKFEIADGGSIFLDEIGDIPLTIQAKLLRVLEEHTFERIGGNERITVNVRTIFATKKKLRQEVAAGKFREDFFYRINVLPVTLPTLRERREDIPLLVEHFLKRFSRKMKKEPPAISPPAKEKLLAYDYPGNVRELVHAIEMATIFCKDKTIGLYCLPEEIRHDREKVAKPIYVWDNLPLAECVRAFEKEVILRVLDEIGGEKKKAAQKLGISRETLWRKLKDHNISDSDSSPKQD